VQGCLNGMCWSDGTHVRSASIVAQRLPGWCLITPGTICPVQYEPPICSLLALLIYVQLHPSPSLFLCLQSNSLCLFVNCIIITCLRS
jgi:hypothetical protein